MSGSGTLGATNGAVTVNGSLAVLNLGGLIRTNGAVVLGNGIITNGTLQATSFSVTNGAVYASLTGGANLTKGGAGTVTLASNNTYTGGTMINAGTLALGGSGSIANSTNISIAAGATFDVSGLGDSATYTLSSSASLTASGTVSAATIKGGSSGTVDLGSQAINLTYDGSHPALYISQGTLSLNGNAFTINSSSPLAAIPRPWWKCCNCWPGESVIWRRFCLAAALISVRRTGCCRLNWPFPCRVRSAKKF